MERACIDGLQACLLRPLVGQQLTGIVVQTDTSAVTVRIDTVAQDTGQMHAWLVAEGLVPRAR